MPKKVGLKTKSGIYQSQIEASKNFEKTVDKIIVRIPTGSRAVITEYVERKAKEEPENLRYSNYNGKAYRPSVNALIRALLEEEIGINLSRLKD